jgi:hypothetical protein
MEINERLVQVMGGAKHAIPIEKELKLGDDVDLLVHGSVAEILHVDDGGQTNVIYKVKGSYCEEV